MVTVIIDDENPFSLPFDLESPLNPFKITETLLDNLERDVELKSRGNGSQGIVHIMKTWHLKPQPADLLPMVENVKGRGKLFKHDLLGLIVGLRGQSIGGKTF